MYLALYGDNVAIGEALFISLFAMLIVFAVLLAISYMVDITAFFIGTGKNNSKKANGVVNDSTANATPVKGANSSSAEVAIIAAAIAAYLGTSADNVVIKKIRRINQVDTSWTLNGLLTQVNG